MAASQEIIVLPSHEELSLLEIHSYCRSHDIHYRIRGKSKFFTIVECQGIKPKSFAYDLGGIFRIASVVASFDRSLLDDGESLSNSLNIRDIIGDLSWKKRWILTTLWDNGPLTIDHAHTLEGYLQKRINTEGWQRMKKIVVGRISSRGGSAQEKEIKTEEIVRRDAVEFIAAILGDKAYLAKTIGFSDQEGFLKRDFERPVQNPMITLPPRIARIMVNLSMVPKGGLLLDPFCGIGTILQEALMRRMRVCGIDILDSRIKGAIANLSWLTSKYGLPKESFRVFVGDAGRLTAHLEPQSVDGIATEPILLPPLRKPLESAPAHKMLERARMTYEKSLVQMAKVLRFGGRIVIVLPLVKLRNGNSACFSIEEFASRIGLVPDKGNSKGAGFPIVIEEKGQLVSRQIYVFLKS